MSDLTVIFYTANVLHEPFAGYVREQLLKSIDGEFPLISISHKPMPGFGDNHCLGEIGRSHLNIYRAILLGAIAAKTDYVGLAEDDVLYSRDHWRTYRPPLHRAGYDLSRWGVNTWETPPRFGYRARPVINQFVGPRQLLINALAERFEKFDGIPDDEIPIKYWAEIGRYEKVLGVTVREWEGFASPTPSVVFSHEEAFGFLNHGKRKSIGHCPRTDLPGWGTAQHLVDLWKQREVAEILRKYA
jgi:hypothetical protein